MKYTNPSFEIKSLAIVGSSSIIMDNESGEDIDSHQHVMRFNRAPTEGYERHVGSKTTIRVVNGHVFECKEFTRWKEDQNFVTKIRNSKLILARDPQRAKNRSHIHDSVEIHIIRHIFGEVLAKWQLDLPTVGLMGILLAVHSGIKPKVYGWTTSPDEPMSHYFNQRSPTTSAFHKWEKELEVINQLAKEGKIVITS
jgi:hypothetical protein